MKNINKIFLREHGYFTRWINGRLIPRLRLKRRFDLFKAAVYMYGFNIMHRDTLCSFAAFGLLYRFPMKIRSVFNLSPCPNSIQPELFLSQFSLMFLNSQVTSLIHFVHRPSGRRLLTLPILVFFSVIKLFTCNL